VIGSITNRKVIQQLGKLSRKLTDGGQATLKKAKYKSPNTNPSYPTEAVGALTVEKKGTDLKVWVERPLYSQIAFLSFSGEIKLPNVPAQSAELTVSDPVFGTLENNIPKTTGVLEPSERMYYKVQSEIEAALTLGNLNRLLTELDNPIVRIKNALGFGKNRPIK
jgi:hypothetical protein